MDINKEREILGKKSMELINELQAIYQISGWRSDSGKFARASVIRSEIAKIHEEVASLVNTRY